MRVGEHCLHFEQNGTSMDYATKKTLRKDMNEKTSSNKSNVFSNWKLKSKINLAMLCHTSFS